MDLEELTGKLLGQGRSGAVFLEYDIGGNQFVRKVFHGSLITNVIHYLSSGAPNPYIWNENAINSAYYRRKILSDLVEYWFDGEMRVAKALGVDWSEDLSAHVLEAEYISGSHAALNTTFSQKKEGELSDLVVNIMKPLQQRLQESGFDGLLWQAGKGNPVATNNFLLEKSPDGNSSWVWIDLESGVPPLIPLNPASFLFYIKKSIQHGSVLFDDVDINKLKIYVKNNESDLKQKIGNDRYAGMLENISKLEEHQEKWKLISRAERGITHQLKKGKITEKQAEWYARHVALWYSKEIAKLPWKAYDKITGDLMWNGLNNAALALYQAWYAKAWKYVYRQKYREEAARNYLAGRINEWEKRKQLVQEQAVDLHRKLESGESASYVTDFGVHLAVQ